MTSLETTSPPEYDSENSDKQNRSKQEQGLSKNLDSRSLRQQWKGWAISEKGKKGTTMVMAAAGAEKTGQWGHFGLLLALDDGIARKKTRRGLGRVVL
ncbi:hypothetical protein KY285_007783 [Solanum tuberosum]|nr:hypothetical protein KY285_007783 [Solanum tuberosum]